MAAPLNIAIVGCGLIGLQLALGLERRGIKVKVYEQARELKEIGAGVGFAAPIIETMRALDPRIAKVVEETGFKSGHAGFIDGLSSEDVRLRPKEQLYDFKLPKGNEQLFTYCQRSLVMAGLAKLVPEGCVEFGKRVDAIERRGDDEPLVIKFVDGTEVEVDAVIGCDGIKSRVRRAVLGPEDPAAVPHYARESAYRCLVDMDKARSALGDIALEPVKWVGQNVSLVTYPIAQNKYLNVAAFIRDDGEWPREDSQVVESSKEDVIKAYASHGPAIRALCEVLPDKLSRWGLFDTCDHPLSTYAYGAVALAGDAAHGSTPHHGSGAGMGVEDALVLATLLNKASLDLSSHATTTTKTKMIKEVFQTFDAVRRGRSQWLVQSSRYQGALDKGEIEGIERDFAKYIESSSERIDRIFDHDWKQMVQQSEDMLRGRLEVSAQA